MRSRPAARAAPVARTEKGRSPETGDRPSLSAGLPHPGAAETRLLRELSDRLSLTPEIRRLRLGEIPRPAGKAVRVVDRRERTGAS